MTTFAGSSTRPISVPAPISRRPIVLHALLIAFAVLIAYGPALQGELIWDDAGHLTRSDLQSLSGLARIWFEIGATQQYYPLLHTAFWLEYQLWGDSVLGYHLVNVLWHAGTAVLFGLLLCRWRVPGAWLAAWLFALHPVAVESVAWISEQKNTLSALLYVGAAYAYWKFRDSRRIGTYTCASLWFLLALLTKTVTATLPAALLVVVWWREGRLQWRRDWLPLLPWFALAVVAGLLTAWFERAIIGAEGADFELSLLERVLLAGRVVWFYLGQLLWPHPLIFIYPRWEISAASGALYLYLLAAVGVLVGLGWIAVRRGVRAPLAVALLFGGTLFPVLGFLNVYPFIYSYVADHFQYHASLSVFAGIGAAGALVAARWSHLLRRALASVVVLLLAVLTWRQVHMYRDVFVLYETTLARNPAAWMAHTNLGIALVDAGRAAAALPHYRETLRLRPNFAEGENNLGYALSELGRPAEAIPHLERAVALKPHYLPARNNLASAWLAAGRTEEGIALFRETLERYPHDSDAHFNLGLALARAGRAAEALPHFEEAVRRDPDDAKYVLHVGMALLFRQRFEEAVPHFERAIALEPDSPSNRYLYGRALLDHRRYTPAVEQLRAAVQLDPEFAPGHASLASALQALGRFDEASRHQSEARRLGER